MKKMLLFQVGTRPYGIDLLSVKSIQRVKQSVAEGTEGSNQLVRVFDDKQTSVYDLVSIFEKEIACRNSENEKLIMVEAEGHSMGMIVSRVDQVVSVDTDRIQPLSPIFKGASVSCFPEVLKHEDALILLLAPEGIAKEALQTEASPEFRLPTEELEIVDMIPEIIDAADIDDGSNCEPASFLANLLQTDRDASAQAEPTDSI
jgi:chemotaxis signal transduction protein